MDLSNRTPHVARTPVSSVFSPKANGNVDVRPDLSNLPPHEKIQVFSTLQNDSASMTPDELFTKFTVAEVKAFQSRLRSSHVYPLSRMDADPEDDVVLMQKQSRRNFDSWLGT